jgi:5'-nucleotidase
MDIYRDFGKEANREEPMVEKKTLYVDMDNVLVDFESGIHRISNDLASRFEDDLDEVPGIFSLMDPIPGAIEAYGELSKKFDTYILSTSPWENPSAWTDKLQWVKKYLNEPAYKRLILTHHKNLNTGHFLIDDRTKNGADRFVGEHIQFGSDAFPDWPTVVAYLDSKGS